MPKHWFKSRQYRHFDWPISKPSQIESRLVDPNEVAKWSFYPFLKFSVKARKFSKENGQKTKERIIMYASHSDSHLYSYYSAIIAKQYEDVLCKSDLSGCVIAYRKLNGKCNIHFAHQAFAKIIEHGECCALAFDIEKFFDSINHTTLKLSWSKVLGKARLPIDHYKIFRSLTKFSYVEKEGLLDLLGISKHNIKRVRLCSAKELREKIRASNLICTNTKDFGIPQGSPLSGLLSNISLLEFDCTVTREAKLKGATYFRYSDDILIICKQEDKKHFRDIVKSQLMMHHLTASDSKTKEHNFSSDGTHIKADTPLQYLGFMFDGKRMYIRSSSIIRFQSKMRCRINQALKSKDSNNKKRAKRGEPQRGLFRSNLVFSNTQIGRRNFIRYGLRAALILGSKETRRQVARLGKQFMTLLDNASN